MEFTIHNAGTHLRIEVSGAPSEAQARKLAAEMIAQSKAGGLMAALVEVRVAFGLNPVASKEVVSALPQLGLPPRYRIAMLLLDEVARRSAEFAENVAQNRGINLRVFRDRAKALAWLLERGA